LCGISVIIIFITITIYYDCQNVNLYPCIRPSRCIYRRSGARVCDQGEKLLCNIDLHIIYYVSYVLRFRFCFYISEGAMRCANSNGTSLRQCGIRAFVSSIYLHVVWNGGKPFQREHRRCKNRQADQCGLVLQSLVSRPRDVICSDFPFHAVNDTLPDRLSCKKYRRKITRMLSSSRSYCVTRRPV
jgi:hypothetical protein